MLKAYNLVKVPESEKTYFTKVATERVQVCFWQKSYILIIIFWYVKNKDAEMQTHTRSYLIGLCLYYLMQ